MADKTIYCGSGNKQNEKWITATINPDKIMDHIQEYKGNRFVKLNININDEPNEFGKDVSITINTWQPNKKEPVEPREDSPYTAPEDLQVDNNDELPF